MSNIKGKVTDINWVISWKYKCLNSDCPICRTPLEINDYISRGTCGHGFHPNCIMQWHQQITNNNKSCPVCSKKWQEQ